MMVIPPTTGSGRYATADPTVYPDRVQALRCGHAAPWVAIEAIQRQTEPVVAEVRDGIIARRGYPDGIESPGTAKNVITVGAIDQLRNITNLVTQISVDGMDLVTNVYAPWADMTDSSNEVTHFSSRGNTGIGQEGTYGRFKPDVVAPGAMLPSGTIIHRNSTATDSR